MIDEEWFSEFKDFRAEIKKPLTERAERMMRKKLERLEREGHDTMKLLERSIINSWQDIYPDDSTKKTKHLSLVDKWTDKSWKENL